MNRGRNTRGRLHCRGRIDIVVQSSSSLNTRRIPLVITKKTTPNTNLLVGSTSRTKYTREIPREEPVSSTIEFIVVDIQEGI